MGVRLVRVPVSATPREGRKLSKHADSWRNKVCDRSTVAIAQGSVGKRRRRRQRAPLPGAIKIRQDSSNRQQGGAGPGKGVVGRFCREQRSPSNMGARGRGGGGKRVRQLNGSEGPWRRRETRPSNEWERGAEAAARISARISVGISLVGGPLPAKKGIRGHRSWVCPRHSERRARSAQA